MKSVVSVLSKSKVESSAEKLGVKLADRGWSAPSKCCPITAVMRANVDGAWAPSSGEPGEDQSYVYEASQKLGVSMNDLFGFVAGWDGHKYTGGRMALTGYLWARFMRWRLRRLVARD